MPAGLASTTTAFSPDPATERAIPLPLYFPDAQAFYTPKPSTDQDFELELRTERGRRAITEWLPQVLREHGVSTGSWGLGRSKTFGHLIEEIVSGETELRIIDERLYRVCDALRIDVRYSRDGRSLQLYEAEQRFIDGRSRVRDSEFAVWEKLKRGEDPDNAVHRALHEELQIRGQLFIIPGAVQRLPRPPIDFPTLPSLITTHDFTACITEAQFRNSYEERQKDKITVFRWRLAPGPIVSRHSSGNCR